MSFAKSKAKAYAEEVAATMKAAGLRVETWSSATEFLARIQDPQHPALGPACLVLDVRMPGMTGMELQQHLAERSAGGHIWPIVFITGHGDIPMTVRAMRAGAIEFLPKPFSDQELLAAILPGRQGAWDTAQVLSSFRLDAAGRLTGALNMHDLLRAGVV